MRIWSLHPKYLDQKGLVALWREALLAQHVLQGKTRGYRNHPQLDRFRELSNPLDSINQYLTFVYYESVERGYNFNREKINWNFIPGKIPVTTDQIDYEKDHLLNKLKIRDKDRYNILYHEKDIEVNPVFKVIKGTIEKWEKAADK